MTLCLRTRFIQFVSRLFCICILRHRVFSDVLKLWDWNWNVPKSWTPNRFWVSGNKLSPAFWGRVPAFEQINFNWKNHWFNQFSFLPYHKAGLSSSDFTETFFVKCLVKFINRRCDAALFVPKVWSWFFYTQKFQLSCGLVPPAILCSSCHCIQAQSWLDSQLGFGQSVPASSVFLHSPPLRHFYVTHFPQSLIRSNFFLPLPWKTACISFC